MKYLACIVLCFFFYSCQNRKDNNIMKQVSYWLQKEIVFPQNSVFTVFGEDTVNMQIGNSYKIVSYVDSIGCVSCKLQLKAWEKFIYELGEQKEKIVLFYMHPYVLKEIQFILKREQFDYPVCFDMDDSFNKLNHLSSNMLFQTFLLDKDNKIVAIGNPIHNFKVRELYLKIIRGGEINDEKTIETEIDIDKTSISLGNFDWQKEQKVFFTLKNIGDKPLVVEYVNTSCGCISVDYSKEPVQMGKKMTLNITYKADHPEHFNKTITVYCNVESSPIKLTILGNAE